MSGKLRRVAETSRCKAGCRKQICVMLFEGDLVHLFISYEVQCQGVGEGETPSAMAALREFLS